MYRITNNQQPDQSATATTATAVVDAIRPWFTPDTATVLDTLATTMAANGYTWDLEALLAITIERVPAHHNEGSTP